MHPHVHSITIAKAWKQFKCPSTDGQVDKEDVVDIYKEILLSH